MLIKQFGGRSGKFEKRNSGNFIKNTQIQENLLDAKKFYMFALPIKLICGKTGDILVNNRNSFLILQIL